MTALTLLAMPPTKTRFGISMPNFGAGDISAELTASRLGYGDELPDAAALAYQHTLHTSKILINKPNFAKESQFNRTRLVTFLRLLEVVAIG